MIRAGHRIWIAEGRVRTLCCVLHVYGPSRIIALYDGIPILADPIPGTVEQWEPSALPVSEEEKPIFSAFYARVQNAR